MAWVTQEWNDLMRLEPKQEDDANRPDKEDKDDGPDEEGRGDDQEEEDGRDGPDKDAVAGIETTTERAAADVEAMGESEGSNDTRGGASAGNETNMEQQVKSHQAWELQ